MATRKVDPKDLDALMSALSNHNRDEIMAHPVVAALVLSLGLEDADASPEQSTPTNTTNTEDTMSNNTNPAPAVTMDDATLAKLGAFMDARIAASEQRIMEHASDVIKEGLKSDEATAAMSGALAAYRADNAAWYESKWVVAGGVAVVAGAVGYAMWRTNKKASAALGAASEAKGVLGEMQISRDTDGILTLGNVKINR